MPFIADFHIHSHFSIATSKDLIPEYLDYWARLKGIKVVGTGDFTHPGWLAELREKLEVAEPGLYRLKAEYRSDATLKTPYVPDQEVRFMLTAEISSIYKKFDKVRKVHNVIFAPDFETVEKIQKALSNIGNIHSDGRPILGLDSRDLLELALNCSEQIFFVPAHIWTPWFSALGAQSGFDSIEECYGDLAHHIHALETGLSSDPAMNRLCSFLDRFTLISNSDAHSPEKLGREANLFDTELSYAAIIAALREKDSGKFPGTVEFFPQEGKYHYDGHRKCGIVWDPLETSRHKGICPVCVKKVTIGVLHRVMQLADRQQAGEAVNQASFHSLVPLKEILAEIHGANPNTKVVRQTYQALLNKVGSEFNLLLHWPLDELKEVANEIIVEAIRRMRSGEVYIKEGYDGEYGQIKVFGDGELAKSRSRSFLKTPVVKETSHSYGRQKYPLFQELHDLQRPADEGTSFPADELLTDQKSILADRPGLNPAQQKAVEHFKGPALVIAGPGTGKTAVLTRRIAHLINERGIAPEQILAVTFTNKAAQEMSERLAGLLHDPILLPGMQISTFHGLGYRLLREYAQSRGEERPFIIIDEKDQFLILNRHLGLDRRQAGEWVKRISRYKQNPLTGQPGTDPEQAIFAGYQRFLRENGLYDLDDLILEPLRILDEDGDFLNHCRERWPWILIDEYQDINGAQYQLIRRLAGTDQPNLCVIGDPEQAIYGFRGADVRFIQRFKEDFQGAAEYDLQQSYRCSHTILRASGNVLSGSRRILQGLPEGVRVTISKQASDKSEAEFVARTIEQMLGGLRFFSMDSAVSSGEGLSDIHSLSDFAVLCRIKKLLPAVEKALNDHSIPYQTLSEARLLEDEPARSILAMLKWAAHPHNAFLESQLTGHLPRAEKDRRELREKLQAIPSVSAKVQFLWQRLDNVAKAGQDGLLHLARTYDNDPEGFLRQAALGVEADAYRREREAVTLMTLHAAKGLEFQCVFIIGCEDGLLPYALFDGQHADAQEESRLLYVGMTRAKKYLYLSHAGKRHLSGREYRLARSPFVERIERELLEQSRAEYKHPRRKDDGQLSLFK